ncbi:polysaccharide deacetylase family protein [Xylophilus rhododendri]|uniref:Polysaccharide deacetylase family protein n=1 Tax=Xylophilus rhododendri TaxID=2697032 RepID=A0A857J6U1_9BURK|nr:polysaccharide deacetylase family protein [Xylophilus rhododendri]QHI98963.1 polysaccharide deacetylase family protein [Xylophilus rhododendri]
MNPSASPPDKRYPAVLRTRLRHSDFAPREQRPRWPGGAQCAVVITVDYDGASNEAGRGWPALGIHSAGRYSARRGVQRYLDLLERRAVPCTFFVPGYDAERFPQSVRDIAAAGHEIGAHGYLHENFLLQPDEEVRRLGLTHRILGDLTGKAPRGWRSPGGQKTAVTLDTLQALGYAYDSSDKDSDMPYLLRMRDGGSMVEIPNNTLSLDDYPWYAVSRTPVSEVQAQWCREFDAIHAAGGFYMLVVHPRASWGSGMPSRAHAVENVIRHIQQHPGARFMELQELADWVASDPSQYDEMAISGAGGTSVL